jgi:glycosyltransferase involved in cell wall biosynthesis
LSKSSKKHILISDLSYIIPFRSANKERLNALYFILNKLRSYFPEMEIMVVEQDTTSKLELDSTLKIKHVFLSNSGLFNKCWALNVAAKNTEKDVLVFGDSDMFLSKEDYISFFAAAELFESATPNKTEALNIKLTENSDKEFELLNKRPLFTFAGGILLLTQSAYEKIGGWDERFEGWGGEDDVMSHVIYNTLSSKTFNFPFYHIDHPRSVVDGQQQENYQYNRNLSEEIRTLSGKAIERYIDRLKDTEKGKSDKYVNPVSSQKSSRNKFVFAVTTYNRFDYLQACISTFLKTRNASFDWQIIIADDGSTDKTVAYLEQLKSEHNAIIIQNNRVDVHRQVNTILKTLSTLEFDLCFKCDDDVVFHQEGWDKLYWETINRTGYQHLIFYDTDWRPHANLSPAIEYGTLVSNCPAENIQGGFYTLTPDIIREVGYFDEQQFGRRGVGHIDFSFRCCRAGYNVIANPFDAIGSNELISLQKVDNYVSSVTSRYKSLFNPKEVIEFKRDLAKVNRIYIPYNENFKSLDKKSTSTQKIERTAQAKKTAKYSKLDAGFYPERGISGFFGFLLKRFYNLGITLKLYFIPAGIKLIGKILNKISLHLMNIED